jgi:acyl-CoA synthetase (AMP-forming)/AMP-acid ligase II
MPGYWGRPEATAEVIIADGWLRTGDIGRMDADGYVFVLDRAKDMIVSGGENVYPAEVENAIFGHPDVADVAVIGVPSERWGEGSEAGVDVFDASVRYFNKAAFADSPRSLAGWAKKLTGRCSMAVGGVGINQGVYDKGKVATVVDNVEPLLDRLAADEFDLVAVGRAMLGDPHWVRKTRAGELIRPYSEEDLRHLE